MARKPIRGASATTPAHKLSAKAPHAQGASARIFSASEVATLLDCSRQTVQAWINRGMPTVSQPVAKGEAYKLDLAAVVRWLQEQAVEHARVSAAPAPASDPDAPPGAAGYETEEEANRRRAIARANREEIAEARDARSVVPIAAVESMVAAEYAAVRQRMEGLPATLAGRTAALSDPSAIQAEASRLVAAALDGMVGDIGAYLEDEGDLDDEDGDAPDA